MSMQGASLHFQDSSDSFQMPSADPGNLVPCALGDIGTALCEIMLNIGFIALQLLVFLEDRRAQVTWPLNDLLARYLDCYYELGYHVDASL